VRAHPATARGALCCALLAALLGCKDKGLIGDRLTAAACEPACAADERCDLELRMCMPCDDCDAPADAGECDDASCARCSDDEQCDEEAPLCIDNRCQCQEDSDCNGEGERECQAGRCVEVNDDEEEESAGDDDELPDEP